MKELELFISKRDTSAYAVGIRLDTDDDGIRVVMDDSLESIFHLDEIEKSLLTSDVAEYGKHLTELVFRSKKLSEEFKRSIDFAESNDTELRVRLLIGENSQELHRIQWECLRSPRDGNPICTNQNLVFSRYMSCEDRRKFRTRNKEDLRTCFLAPVPADINEFKIGDQRLQNPKHDQVLRSIESAVPKSMLTHLSGGGKASFASLKECLIQGVDILVILCHGVHTRGETVLFMEDEKGNTGRCHAIDLISTISSLKKPPALVVMMSCESFGEGANTGDTASDPLTSLAPRLVEVGVPAVLAMQGKISEETAVKFLDELFIQLGKDGCIDRAVSVARSLVSEMPDWYIPTLFTRLRSGRIWHKYGFDSTNRTAGLWLSIAQNIKIGKCTPIVGSGVTKWLVGSRSELSQDWAGHYGYPLAPYLAEQFPHVAQYVKTNFGDPFLWDQLEEYCRHKAKERHSEILDDLDGENAESLVRAIVKSRHQNEEKDLLSTISRLPFPVYITTGFTEALEHCLRLEGKKPVMEYCRWNDDLVHEQELVPSRFKPSCREPLVYHLFGIQSKQESLVLSEDDYFNFLLGISVNRDKIPRYVKHGLTNTSLLLMGFVLDDWEFRAMFHLAKSFEGGRRRQKGYKHVAAQIDPEDGRVIKPEKAREYLETYLGDAHVNIFWGSSSVLARHMNNDRNMAELVRKGCSDD